MARILVIDDDPAVTDTITAILQRDGHAVGTAANGVEGMNWLKNYETDLVITDLLMPEQEGIETIRQIRRRSLTLPILAITGGGRWGAVPLLEAARIVGANDILAKPFGKNDLASKVEQLLRLPLAA